MAPEGVGPLELVLQLLLPGDKASAMAASLRRGTRNPNSETRPFTSQSWRSAKQSKRSARGAAKTVSTKQHETVGSKLAACDKPVVPRLQAPWEQRRHLSLVRRPRLIALCDGLVALAAAPRFT